MTARRKAGDEKEVDVDETSDPAVGPSLAPWAVVTAEALTPETSKT
jgi:hypothetical protein